MINRCPISYPHLPHDYCDGTPSNTREDNMDESHDSSVNDTINYDERWEIVMEPYETLEYKLAHWLGLPNMVVCSSGTAALHLALECLQLPPGSEVLVPDFAFISCARAVTLAGLVPVFVDVSSDKLLIDHVLAEQYAERYSQGSNESLRLSVILAVHTYGRQCDMTNICALAQQEGLYVIEDMAECPTVAPHPRTDVACWSFHKSKVVHGEEGGSLSFRKGLEAKVELAKCLRTLGHSKEGNYLHTPRGHNYRMSNLHARAILDSLANVDRNLRQRHVIQAWYNEHCPILWQMPARYCPWTYDIRLPGITTDGQQQTITTLRKNGIEARYPFKPLSLQEEYHRHTLVYASSSKLHNALVASREIIRLPINPSLDSWHCHKQVRECFDIIRDILSS